MFPRILLFSLMLFSSCITVAQKNSQEKDINHFILNKISNYKIPGFAACIVARDSIKWKAAFGYEDVKNKKLFNTKTVINIASVSKTFVGFAIMIAVDKELIGLDDDINAYIHEYQIKNPDISLKQNITVRNLATHTSGIIDRNEVYMKTYTDINNSKETLSDFLSEYLAPSGSSYSKDNFIPYKPGAYYQYSNIGAALAAEVLSRAAKMSFNDFCNKYIFQPLKMNGTGWFLADVKLMTHSKLYSENMQEIPLYNIITYPDGGLRTNMDDLSKFLIMVINHGKFKGKRIISSSGFDEMIKPQFNSLTAPYNIDTALFNQGIFWHIDKNSKIGALIGHTGGDPGVTSYMYFSPLYSVGVIMIINKSLTAQENICIKDILTKLWEFAFN